MQPKGKIHEFLETWLGASYKTTLYGAASTFSTIGLSVSGGLMAAYANPAVVTEYWFVIKLLPQDWMPVILGVSAIVKIIAGIMAWVNTKGKEVTGGTVEQDSTGHEI
jgi:hypothetical protein